MAARKSKQERDFDRQHELDKPKVRYFIVEVDKTKDWWVYRGSTYSDLKTARTAQKEIKAGIGGIKPGDSFQVKIVKMTVCKELL